MRFTVTGEWDRNRLLQVIVVLYSLFVALLWATNWMLYFESMDLTTASVVDHFLGNEEEFRAPRSYKGMVELAHFHLFAGNQSANYGGAEGDEDWDDEGWD